MIGEPKATKYWRTNQASESDACERSNLKRPAAVAYVSVSHPAHTNRDQGLTTAEFHAYDAAWLTGPNPIPINYLTRAGCLATNGQRYRQASGLSLPPAWKPKPAVSPSLIRPLDTVTRNRRA